MGYLFENMDKIDIQEERRKTAEERRKQEEAKREAEAERQKAEAERQKAEAERQKAEMERHMREETVENAIRIFIEGYQELNASRELTLAKIIDKFQIQEQTAVAKMKQYWKE